MTTCHVDRRAFRRIGIGEHGIVSARVRPAHPVEVIDVSAAGALIEVSKRLVPGASIDLQLETTHGRTMLAGRVVRSAINRLRCSSVSYRAAIAFDRHWQSVLDDRANGYRLPASEARVSCDERVDSTRETV